jgi:hypothetical protein
VHVLPDDWGDHSTPPLGRVQIRFVKAGRRTRVVESGTAPSLDDLTDDQLERLFDGAE